MMRRLQVSSKVRTALRRRIRSWGPVHIYHHRWAGLGGTGDVGGRASGAELTECAARLCDATRLLCVAAFGFRVFVNVIDTASGSPA